MSVLTQQPKENEARLRQLEALARQFDTDIKRLWKRFPATPDHQQGQPITAAHPVDPEEVFVGPLSGFQFSGTAPGSGASSPPTSGTNLNTGQSGGGSGPGRSGGTPDVSGGTLQTGGHLTGGTLQTGATAGTGFTGGNVITGGTFTGQGTGGTIGTPSVSGSGTPDSGINTGASGGGSGIGVSGGTALSGSPQSGTPLSGTPQSGVCIGPMLFDNFADTNGLQLAFHVPDYDRYAEGWQGDVNDMHIGSNRLVADTAPTTSFTERIVYSNAREKNVKLSCSDVIIDTGSSYAGFVTRYASDLDMWILRASRADTALQIIEVNAGTRTVRASAGVPSAQLSNKPMDAIVRDRYIRFTRGNHWVSYGSASHLEGATRHGIYAAISGSTELVGATFADYLADCLPSNTSGTGRSGSKSESHLSGGGATGGTVNTGGTPAGTQGTCNFDPIFRDAFTDTNGVDLDVHTPTVKTARSDDWGTTPDDSGNYDIQSNAAKHKAGTGNDVKIATVATLNSEVRLRVTATVGQCLGTEAVGFTTRRTDGNNSWNVRALVSNNSLEIFEVNAGVATLRASKVSSVASNTAYNLTLIAQGSVIRFSRERSGETHSVQYNSATYNQTAQIHGIWSFQQNAVTNRNAFDNFVIDCPPSDTSGTGISGSSSPN